MASWQRFRTAMGPLWWSSSLYFVVSRFGDAVNLFVSAFLVPAFIARDQLGAVVPLTYVANLLGLPLGVLLQTAMKFLGLFADQGRIGKAKRLLKHLTTLMAALSLLIALLLWTFGGFTMRRMKIEQPAIPWLVGAVAVMNCWLTMALTTVRAFKQFRLLLGAVLLIGVVRLATSWLLIEPLQLAGYLLSQLAATASAWLVMQIGVARRLGRDTPSESYREHLGEMGRYLWPTVVVLALGGLSATVGPWVIRQRLSEADSAGYYMAALFGNVPLFVSSALTPFLFPLVSQRHERGDSTWRLHLESMGVTFGLSLLAAMALWACGGSLFALRSDWRVHQGYAGFIAPVALLATLGGLVGCHLQHEMACRRFAFLAYYTPVVLLEAGGLYAAMGWHAFADHLPRWLADLLSRTPVHSLGFVLGYLTIFRSALVAGLVVEVAARWSATRRPKGDKPCSASP